MRLINFVLLLTFSCLGLAVKPKPAASKFDTYLARKPSFPLNLDEKEYEELTGTPRDYSVAVLLTALDARFACELCRNFQPEWDIIGKSWQKGDKKGQHRVLFTTLDFERGRNVFVRVCDFIHTILWHEGST